MNQDSIDHLRALVVRLRAVVTSAADAAAAVPHPAAENSQALMEVAEEQIEAILQHIDSAASQQPVAA